MDLSKLHTIQLGQEHTGTPIVMLHGWMSNVWALKPLGELLARYAPVHLIDLPGFGKSPPPGDAWGSIEYSDLVLEYLDSQGLEQVDLMGHSFGGRVSMRLAARNPERVRKLVLVGSHGLKRKRSLPDQLRVWTIPKLGKLVKLFDRTTGNKFFQNWFAPRFGSRDYQNAGALRGTMVRLALEDQALELPKIKAATLLLWGKEDNETPLEMGQRMAALISNSHLIAFDGEGHHPFDDVGAHRCAYFICKFLDYEVVYSVEAPLEEVVHGW